MEEAKERRWKSEDWYAGTPAPILAIVGPFLGLVFIIVWPLVGICGLALYLGKALWKLNS